MVYLLRRVKKIFLWLAVFIFIAAFFLPLISKLREMRAKHNLVQEKVKQEQQRNQELQEKKRLKNDPFYLEKIARQKLGITRDKEVLYKVITEPEKESGPGEKEKTIEEGGEEKK